MEWADEDQTQRLLPDGDHTIEEPSCSWDEKHNSSTQPVEAKKNEHSRFVFSNCVYIGSTVLVIVFGLELLLAIRLYGMSPMARQSGAASQFGKWYLSSTLALELLG
jgi:hypothetical protein